MKHKRSQQKMAFVCIDSSEHSLRAFEWYLEKFHRENQKIGLIHVQVPPEIPSLGFIHGTIDLHTKEIQRSIDASQAVVDKFEKLCLDKNIKHHIYCEVLEDSVGHTICKAAKHRNASLLIVGQRGLGAIRRTFFGSVSDYVLHHSHVPTIVVPPSS